MTSASSWNILVWILSGPIDLYGTSRCHTSSEYAEGLSCSQSWSFSSRHWDPFSPSSVLETKPKKELNISALPLSQFVRGPSSSCSGLILFLHYLLLLTYFKNPLIIASHICLQLQLQLSFVHTSFPRSKQHFCIPPTSPDLASTACTFIFCLISQRKLLSSQTGLLPVWLLAFWNCLSPCP